MRISIWDSERNNGLCEKVAKAIKSCRDKERAVIDLVLIENARDHIELSFVAEIGKRMSNSLPYAFIDCLRNNGFIISTHTMKDPDDEEDGFGVFNINVEPSSERNLLGELLT